MTVLHTYQHWSKALGRLRGIRTYETKLKGCQVHFYAKRGSGGGPPAVLLHGLGINSLIYFKVFSSLAQKLRAVYALDFPGFGFSPLPPEGPLSPEGMAELAQSFLSEEVKVPVFLFGNSLGGAVAAQVASQNPEQVRALCLWAPAGAPLSPEEVEALSKLFEVHNARQARALLRRAFARTPWYMEWLAACFVPLLDVPAMHFIRQNSLQHFLEPQILHKLQMPTLLVWGACEKLLPPRGIDYFREYLPKGAAVLEVQRFGHMPQWESPRKCMRIWWEFAQKRGLI